MHKRLILCASLVMACPTGEESPAPRYIIEKSGYINGAAIAETFTKCASDTYFVVLFTDIPHKNGQVWTEMSIHDAIAKPVSQCIRDTLISEGVVDIETDTAGEPYTDLPMEYESTSG